MGLREGSGQGPVPPAPAAADGGCRAPEPRLQRTTDYTGHLSRAPGEGGGKSLTAQEPPRSFPWVLNALLFSTRVTQVKSSSLAPKASTLALRPLRFSTGTFSTSSTELRVLDSLISSLVKRNGPRVGEWRLRVGWKGSSDPEDSGLEGREDPLTARQSASRAPQSLQS